jgi:hypothetical protein
MEFLFFLFGLITGAIIMLAIICILAIGSTHSKNKGDKSECTNQKQQ